MKDFNLMRAGFKPSALVLSILSTQALANVDCSNIPEWEAGIAYTAGMQAQQENIAYESNWWNKVEPKSRSGQWQEWTKLGSCQTDVPVNEAPKVILLTPADGNLLNKNDSVAILAEASDTDGQVEQVEVYLDGQLLITLSAAPFEFNWTAVLGEHVFYAIAQDDDGARTESARHSVTVQKKSNENRAPVVSLAATLPSELEVGSQVTFNLSASDADGHAVMQTLTVNGEVVVNSTKGAEQFVWTPTVAGTYTFTLTAKDELGLAATPVERVYIVKEKGDPITGHENCRPAGLYQAQGVQPAYCDIYDTEGREKMGADHPRRVIGYFTSWRNGANGQPSYLVKDIPWDKITHINYAFAHVNAANELSIGDPNAAGNAATNMTWPGVEGAEMDPSLPYKGHFNLLNKYKKLHPDVKTMISVGGWAETGGFFDSNGNRVNSGGFYTMTTNADGSVNHAGIDAFVASAVKFIREYGFDGVDIDYEYPSSMKDSGHPDDFPISNARRAGLNASYDVLMRKLREALDAASAQDNTHYMLTIASPSSGYLLRGMETFQTAKYLDFVNIMSYDLHGAWNDHVGHNAALYDTGKDSELAQWNVYGTKEFEGIGYLNTDWAATYFRGALPAGRINIGLPYYTRGFRDVQGGDNGLWGRAALPNQADCAPGTGVGEKNKCGNGAVGIDNLWHDTVDGIEVPAGSNPLWHVKNLQNGITPSYLGVYGLDPANNPEDKMVGTYTRHYDSVAIAPWLFNAEKKVFLSIEDEESMKTKLDYVVNKELGGVMFWELAGDFDYDTQKGEYFMGSTMTRLAYDTFNQASTPYGAHLGDGAFVPAAKAVDIKFEAKNFPVGDDNYPIRPTFAFTNNSEIDLSGATISFNIPVSTSAIFKSDWNAQKKLGIKIDANNSNAAGNNIGGFENEFHRASITLTNEWGGAAESFKPGETVNAQVLYYIPITGPVNFTIEKDGASYAFASEYPKLPIATKPDTGNPGNGDPGTGSCNGVDVTTINTYPDWPRTDWAGNPRHANAGDYIIHNQVVYQANWWTSKEPVEGGDWKKVCAL